MQPNKNACWFGIANLNRARALVNLKCWPQCFCRLIGHRYACEKPMRDKYYSDDRDLVKWATLTHIAMEFGLQTILQVSYWRPEKVFPHFSFMGKRVPISNKVWTFFRNIHNISRLGQKIGISIAVVDRLFNPDQRDAYVFEVKTKIQQAKRPLALFLDPDIGLQPKRCCPEHTATWEIQALWPILKKREWLILYQHARRNSNWRESVADELSSLCGNMKAHVIQSDDVGKDVAFICIEKEGVA